MIGKIFDNAFRIRTYNRCISFIIGGAFTYSLANPDIDTVYEFFPIFRQNKYAYITFMQVDEKDNKIFEESLKNLCRFYQKQQGYLYTKIIKEKKQVNKSVIEKKTELTKKELTKKELKKKELTKNKEQLNKQTKRENVNKNVSNKEIKKSLDIQTVGKTLNKKKEKREEKEENAKEKYIVVKQKINKCVSTRKKKQYEISSSEENKITKNKLKGNSIKKHAKKGEHILMRPEDSISLQNFIGADIIMALDDVRPALENDVSKIEEATERTNRWLDRCIKSHKKKKEQSLFGIIQGGLLIPLRNKSMNYIFRKKLNGYALGGLCGGEKKTDFFKIVEHCSNSQNMKYMKFPNNKCRYIMGIGYLLDIVLCSILGYDMFDCVYPTRTARFGTALSYDGVLKLRQAKYKYDFSKLQEECNCLTCQRFTKATLHMLLSQKNLSIHSYLTIHNLSFIGKICRLLKIAIMKNKLDIFITVFLYNYFVIGIKNGNFMKPGKLWENESKYITKNISTNTSTNTPTNTSKRTTKTKTKTENIQNTLLNNIDIGSNYEINKKNDSSIEQNEYNKMNSDNSNNCSDTSIASITTTTSITSNEWYDEQSEKKRKKKFTSTAYVSQCIHLNEINEEQKKKMIHNLKKALPDWVTFVLNKSNRVLTFG